jgi:hypothetical protein
LVAHASRPEGSKGGHAGGKSELDHRLKGAARVSKVDGNVAIFYPRSPTAYTILTTYFFVPTPGVSDARKPCLLVLFGV